MSGEAGRPHPDEALLPEMPLPPELPPDESASDRAEEIARLRAVLAAIDPDYGRARGLFQFMTGSWSRFLPRAESEALSGDPEMLAEALKRSRSHFTGGSGPWRIAHESTAPTIGCAYCLASDRSEGAIAALRSFYPDERFFLPHAALYVLAVDDLRRERLP